MTTFFIGYSDIARKGILTASPAAESGYPETNLCLGSRRNFYRSGTAQATHTLTWDLGAGESGACNYLFIARADMFVLSTTDATVDLKSSDDDSSYTSEAATLLATSDLVGPQARDFLDTFELTSDARYWRIELTNSASGDIQPAFSKVMFGEAFDFGRDPSIERRSIRDVKTKGQRESQFQFELEWEGITDTKIQSFLNEIGDYIDVQPVVLFTTSYHPILHDLTAVHCIIKTFSVEPINFNNNRISLELEECI